MFPEETYAVNFFKLHDVTLALNSFKTELFQVSHQTPVYQKITIFVFSKPTSQTAALSCSIISTVSLACILSIFKWNKSK